MPTSSTIGQSFIELKEADSTNNYAMAAAKDENAFHGLAWYTDNQTAGRGQRGRQWSSQPGENMALSILLDTSSLSLHEQFSMIVLSALAVYDLLVPFGKESLKIKWPNDIYINDKKAGGILTESVIRGKKWQWTVVGIGLNVNQSSFENKELSSKAISLFQILDERLNTRDLAVSLCEKMEYRWQQLLQYGAPAQLEEYNQYLFRKGQTVQYKNKNEHIFSCTIDHVDSDGKLHVWNSNKEEIFNFGEVELLLNRDK